MAIKSFSQITYVKNTLSRRQPLCTMTDRGAYTHVSDGTLRPQTSYTAVEDRLKAGVSSLAAPLQPLRRRTRFLLGVSALALLAIIRIFSYQHAPEAAPWRSDSLDAAHLSHLASPLTGYESSTVDNETARVVGEHHAVQGNYADDYQWLDPYSKEPFVEAMNENGNCNNAIGRLPAGSPYDALVVARGRNDKYKDPRESVSMVNLTIVGFFVNYNPQSREWERAGPEPYVLDLPVWRQFPRPCQNLVNGGQADPRFIWSDAGEPLAVIGTASRVPGVCKAIGMVDLRAVWPGLKEHLAEIGYGDIPIKFDTFTEVGKASKKEKFEKNWAPFFSGPKPASQKTQQWLPSLFGSSDRTNSTPTWPFFASQIVPRTILEVDTGLDPSERSPDSYVLSTEIDLSMRVNETLSTASSDCLIDSLPHTWDPHQLHQATPYYRVTMCPRGTCIPSRQNTVLLGLVHYKKTSSRYRRMFVTMSTDAPFRILSVSPPLHFGSVKHDQEVVFSVSMAFFPTNSAAEQQTSEDAESPFRESSDVPGGYLNHGWLDDTLVVGAGLRNEAYDSIHLPVATALRGHTLCPLA